MSTPFDPPTQRVFPVPPPDAPTGRGRGNLIVVLIIGAVLIITGIVVALVLTFSGEDTFDVKGTFTLTDGATGIASIGECAGYRGYDDITPNAQVTVYDNTNAVLAVSQLGPGRYTGSECIFDISVKGVPRGGDLYQVEVSGRGKIAFTEEEASVVKLSLGN